MTTRAARSSSELERVLDLVLLVLLLGDSLADLGEGDCSFFSPECGPSLLVRPLSWVLVVLPSSVLVAPLLVVVPGISKTRLRDS